MKIQEGKPAMGYASTGAERLPPANVGQGVLERVMVLCNIKSLTIAAQRERAANADRWKVVRVPGRFDPHVGELESFLLDGRYFEAVEAKIRLIEQVRTDRVGV